ELSLVSTPYGRSSGASEAVNTSLSPGETERSRNVSAEDALELAQNQVHTLIRGQASHTCRRVSSAGRPPRTGCDSLSLTQALTRRQMEDELILE
ncbi:hypothetical protein KUCAC02_015000, partial [Chaenocephalus aceratus]